MKWIVNGEFQPAPSGGMSELPVKPGVFETLLLRAGRPVFMAEHWARFEVGCRGQALAWPRSVTPEAITGLARELAQENGINDGVLRFAAWRESDATEWRVEVSPPRPHMARTPWRVRDGGAVLPPATPDHVSKHLRRTLWAAALRDARTAGWDEVVLSDLSGRLVEGGGTNLFFVREGVLHTPGMEVGPLPGIMRAQVLALAAAHGWPVRTGVFTRADLTEASELWLTNSLVGVRPVASLEKHVFEAGYPVLHQLRVAWQAVHGWDPLVVLNPAP